MNKRIRKKHFTQKRNASRKLILSMDDSDYKYRMLMLHIIRFGDAGFVHEVQRIKKKKMTQKRNASRKLILSMEEGDDKDRMLMRHVILFNDYKFFHEVEGNVWPYYVIIPRINGKRFFYRLMLEYINNLNKKE